MRSSPGEDPEKLADLAHSRIKAPRKRIVESLRGRVRDHHRFVLRLHLEQVEALTKAIDAIEARLGEQLDPFREQAALLMTVPGISNTAAHAIISELGVDMARFKTAEHLVSWAGLCPGNDESAGKRRSSRIRKGARWLKTLLVQCAWAAMRTKGSYLRARYYRLKSRRGTMKAVVAVAASMLRSIHAILSQRQAYKDLGESHFDQKHRLRTANRLLKRLKDIGVDVRQISLSPELAEAGVSL
jgi:transposase